jgi:hypothetical protein
MTQKRIPVIAVLLGEARTKAAPTMHPEPLAECKEPPGKPDDSFFLVICLLTHR